MTRDELDAEFKRIVGAAYILPPSKRLDYVKGEVQKLPPEDGKFLYELILTTENLADDRTSMKMIKYQISVSAACLIIGTILAFCFNNPNGIQYLFMRGFFALGCAGIGCAVLMGTINLKWTITKSLVITATGGIALLVLFYKLNPPPPPDLKPSTSTRTIFPATEPFKVFMRSPDLNAALFERGLFSQGGNAGNNGLLIQNTSDVMRRERGGFAPTGMGKFRKERVGQGAGDFGEGVAVEEKERGFAVKRPQPV